MAGTFNLSPEQQATWIEQLPALRRGLQTEIAKELERKRHGEHSSWKTQLSAFFQGKEKGLKAVFEHPARLEIVAKHLGTTPAKLRRWLDIAAGVPVQDEPGLVRVPGFEDYGALPVEEVFFPPRLREARFHLPRHGHQFSSGGGRLDLDKLVEIAATTIDPATPKAVVVVGARGSGRSPTLEAIAHRLIVGGQDVSRWQPGQQPPDEGATLIVDDFDELEVVDRAEVLELGRSSNGVLLCSAGFHDQLRDLPAERAIIELAEGDEPWARAYLAHLAGPISSALARQIDTAPLQKWLSDEPDATAFLDRADTLGLLARHVADGGSVPVPAGRLLDLVVRRWAHLLRRDGRGPEALTIELCLPQAMARLALAACREGRWSHRIDDVARALVEVAGDHLAGSREGTWQELGAPGMLAVVEALVERGFLIRRGEELEPVQRVLQGTALGHALLQAPDDLVTLGHAVVDPGWHEGVLVAAGLAGDIAPMLRAIEALPIGPRVHAYPLVTRLLAASVDCSNRALLGRWFRRCVLWWATTPPESRSVTMTIGSGSPSPPLPSKEALIGGTCPLLVLGRASRLRRKQLDGPRSPDDLVSGAGLPADEARYLELMGRRSTDQTLGDALVVGAPYQCDLVLDPASWARFPSSTVRGHELPGGLTREEYGIWWRTTGAPRLLEESSGRSRIAGTKLGWSITWSMSQPEDVGTKVWSAAIAQEINDGVEEGPNSFAKAVSYLVQVGGLANFEGLRTAWSQVHGRRRRPVWAAVAEHLPPPEDWFIHDTFIPWVLRELLRRDALLMWWSTWTSETGQTLQRIPWRAFLEAGLPQTDVLSWALETMPEQPRAAGKTATRIPTTGSGLVLQLHEPQDAPQAAALDHLVEASDPALLEALLAAPPEWSQRTWKRLEEVAPERSRVLRLEWAASSDDAAVRAQLVSSLVPKLGEFDLWKALAEASDTWHERLVRWVQAAAAAEGEDRWQAAVEVTSLLEALLEPKEQAAEAIGDMFAADVDESASAQAREAAGTLVEELHGKVPTLLHDLGNVLALAPEPDAGLDGLVRRILGGPLRPFVRGHQGLWVLAWRVGGLEYVAERLEVGHHDDDTGAATLERLYACVSVGLFDQTVRKLLLHEVLGRSATLVFANRIAAQHDDLMRQALVGQPMTGEAGQPDPATLALARRLATVDAEGAVRWVEQALTEADAATTRQWWESLLPAIGPGRARARAVAGWARAASSVT